MYAQAPRKGCTWCTGGGHTIDRCYAKDPENVTRFPHSSWVNGEALEFVKLKYNKKHTQEEARNMVNRLSRPSPAHYHQASLALTPPPIYTAVTSNNQASSSTSTDRYRQEGRYNFLVPETVTEQEQCLLRQLEMDCLTPATSSRSTGSCGSSDLFLPVSSSVGALLQNCSS